MPNPAKIIISPGQGLLLLIDHYKNDPGKVARLKKLYLSGASDSSTTAEIKNLLKDKVLAEYQISYEAKTINDDPTRRYFETHLSYESLQHNLDKIDLNDLSTHVSSLSQMLLPDDRLSSVQHVLNGEFREGDNDLMKEYADYISKIRSGNIFGKLSSDDRKKIELLVQSSFLGVVNAWYTPMPLNIYGTGFYSEENKGKIMIAGQSTTRSQHLGLMRGHMPLPLDDVARSSDVVPYMKPSDQATFREDALWTRMNFNSLVHPFSNSISGTMLCQLRALAKLRDDAALRGGEVTTLTSSGEKIAQYSQLLASAMLFNSGGHTLQEFTAPLTLPETRSEFSTSPGFDNISLESMYHTGNERAFDSALDDTISYNSGVLLRKKVLAQLTAQVPIVHSASEMESAIKHKEQMLIHDISTQKDLYAKRIAGQVRSSARDGFKKNELIQEGLNKVLEFLKAGDHLSAKQAITALKEQIVSKFGKTNIWQRESESYKLVTSVEKDIEHLSNSPRSMRERLHELRESSSSVEQQRTAPTPK